MSALKAIRAYCINCCCGSAAEVKLCPVEKCELYKYRLGHDPDRKKRELTDEQRAACAERMNKARLVKNSTSINDENLSLKDE